MKKLLDIMATLRDPQTGCPWDIKQTYKSIVPYTLEEAYEVADAIEHEDMPALKSELGDLLFQVVFYAQIAEEKGDFNFSDVVDAVSEKLISRHPHVFSDIASKGEAALHEATLYEAWEQAKSKERDEQSKKGKASILSGVAKALPALKRAQKLQRRAAREGFDWPSVEPVLEKIEEEINELKEAVQQQNKPHIFEEMGDVLFSCVNLARHIEVDSEESLRSCNQKFERRFSYIERSLDQQARSFGSCTLDELEALWQDAKKSEALKD
ncbi:Nucleoside triphosphate pyrophosphohydrolase MazG [hydrothermal vent metagenome]|uniref:Nucleoside triphosphate pyrophosphohydrolase MazG n=1 Tax=hydrothermal vent metagenome TaxID=652676 RepID=A0A3B0YSF0_9ZZZZ